MLEFEILITFSIYFRGVLLPAAVQCQNAASNEGVDYDQSGETIPDEKNNNNATEFRVISAPRRLRSRQRGRIIPDAKCKYSKISRISEVGSEIRNVRLNLPVGADPGRYPHPQKGSRGRKKKNRKGTFFRVYLKKRAWPRKFVTCGAL